MRWRASSTETMVTLLSPDRNDWRSRRWSGRKLIGLAFGAGLAVAVLSGCSRQKIADDFVEVPAETLYTEAVGLYNAGSYKQAAAKFEEVDRQHPYSSWAKKALLMSSFSHFRSGAYDDAESAAERFLALHPGSEDAAYAQFLIAQSHYVQISDIGRDQTEARAALKAYTEITRLYPESQYAVEAERKQDELLNHLAGKEMEVGRYYMGQQNYLAAVNRFKSVVADFQTTNNVEEALLRLTECYLALGIVTEAQTAAAILGHNYPDSQWYKDAYALLQKGGLEPNEDRGSWLSRTWRRVT